MTWEHWVLLAWAAKELLASMSVFLAPPRADDSTLYRVIYSAANAVALNIGHARNAAQPEPKGTS